MAVPFMPDLREGLEDHKKKDAEHATANQNPDQHIERKRRQERDRHTDHRGILLAIKTHGFHQQHRGNGYIGEDRRHAQGSVQ